MHLQEHSKGMKVQIGAVSIAQPSSAAADQGRWRQGAPFAGARGGLASECGVTQEWRDGARKWWQNTT